MAVAAARLLRQEYSLSGSSASSSVSGSSSSSSASSSARRPTTDEPRMAAPAPSLLQIAAAYGDVKDLKRGETPLLDPAAAAADAAAAAAAGAGAGDAGASHGMSQPTLSVMTMGSSEAATMRLQEENNKVLNMLLADDVLAATPGGGAAELLGPLDDPLFFRVCSFLTPRELLNAGSVGYLWAVLLESNSLWAPFLPAGERAGVLRRGRDFARTRFLELAERMRHENATETREWAFDQDMGGRLLLPDTDVGAVGRRFPLPEADLRSRFAATNAAVLRAGGVRPASVRRLCCVAAPLAPLWAPFVAWRQRTARRRVAAAARQWQADDKSAGIVRWEVGGGPFGLRVAARLRAVYHPVDERVERILAVGFRADAEESDSDNSDAEDALL